MDWKSCSRSSISHLAPPVCRLRIAFHRFSSFLSFIASARRTTIDYRSRGFYKMACGSSCIQPVNLGLGSQTKLFLHKSRVPLWSYSPGKLLIRAVQENEGPRRLVDIIRLIPDISRNYFKSRPRRALFGGISLLGGFYVAQTISLSFGALGVNDVIAAVVCVLLTEFVTRFYYSRPRVTFPVALLNNFKMGFTYGLFIDAFKLAS
ncbi:ycf20-like protein [Zingiber officinale]|uniref:ycf20-like protein n=1 Tax=Zingiber officinale TaxID=94328 RepID=UPI001C4B6A19|nr:ycf20-like protein [Zingiber officinale]